MDISGCRSPRSLEMEHQVPVNGLTIMDYLNEDCWRAVLDYVPILDILKSELVSKRWQKVGLNYLSHVHIGIQHWAFVYYRRHRNLALLEDQPSPSFRSWTKKLGNSIVSYHCKTEEGLNVAEENCPNVEDLTLMKVWYKPPWADGKIAIAPTCSSQNFKRLKILCFFYCTIMPDACVSRLLASNYLEEIRILVNGTVTGQCFTDLKSTKLKRLVLKKCSALQFPPLLAAADRLSGLTTLVLKHVSNEISDNVHVLLDRMPGLEHLYVKIVASDCSDRIDEPFYESVCKLRSLKFLKASNYGTGQHVEDVARSCTELRVMHLETCYAAPSCNFEALCQVAGPRLEALGVYFSDPSHDDLLTCIRSCPNLTYLSAPGLRVDVDLAARAAAARRAHAQSTPAHAQSTPAHAQSTPAHTHTQPAPPRLHIRLYTEGRDINNHRSSDDYKDVLRFSWPRHNDRDSDEISE